MRIAVVVLLAMGLAGLPDGRTSPDWWSPIPCSLEEIEEGIRNWQDHQTSEGCWHSGSEKFFWRCRLYWSKGLD